MALIKCKKHGFCGAQLVSEKVAEYIKAGIQSSDDVIILITMLFDDIELPGVFFGSEMVDIGLSLNGRFDEGVLRLDHEVDAENFIGMLTPVCIDCLNESTSRV